MIKTIMTLAAGLAMAAAVPFGAIAKAAEPVTYKSVKIHDLDIFYREAGPRDAPTVMLLHGFPSSSHMFRDLIPMLATKYHVIAPDYPGFGHSSAPSPQAFSYTFSNIADVVDEFTAAVGAQDYFIYMQDYGGPVGLRLAVKHPERVRGLIVQNAVANVEGWNAESVKAFSPFWQNRNAETEKPARGLLAAETTQFQYTHGEPRADRLSGDSWLFDQALLDRPGNDLIQLELLYQYQDNVGNYPKWQAYLSQKKPPILVVWGDNDPFFTIAGRDLFKTLAPKTEVHHFEAGHFALETHGPEIASAMLGFLDRVSGGK